MILGDDFTPLSRLSSAFLAPKTGMHLQFAYFESALAVEFLVEEGRAWTPPRGCLDDLGAGVTLNEALPGRSGMTLEQLDARVRRLRPGKKAEAIAPGMRPGTSPSCPRPPTPRPSKAWLKDHPKSFPGLRKRLAGRLVAGAGSGRRRGPRSSGSSRSSIRTTSERTTPTCCSPTVCPQDLRPARRTRPWRPSRPAGDAGPAYLRLMELEEGAGDWTAWPATPTRMLAVNPLVPARTGPARPGRRAARPGRRGPGRLQGPGDPRRDRPRRHPLSPGPDAPQGLGKPDEARREVLKSLEDAPGSSTPTLLLELAGPDPPKPKPSSNPSGAR